MGRRLVAPRLVGRDRELVVVDHVLERVGEPDTPSLLLIRGEAGIGKTRLLDRDACGPANRGIELRRSMAVRLEQVTCPWQLQQVRVATATAELAVHVSHILHKLGVPNRVAAAGIAHRLDREPT